MLPVQKRLDVFELIPEILEDRVEFYVVKQTLKELENLSKNRGKSGMAARVALELLKSRKVRVLDVEGRSCDEAILRVATNDFIVATNDKMLRKRLKGANVKTIYLRSKKYLGMD